jgi:serine/threonine protein kinase
MPEVLRRVGRYDLLEVIGRGGAAVVYLADQRDLRRHVALKELAPYHAGDGTFAQRFVEESRMAGAMNHAHVVTVHEFFEDGGVPYIAMEYVPHGSLRQYVGRLTLAQIAGVLEGVLAGLSHGEAHLVVHRDLKPENLLVGSDGRVKIADFGVARAYNKAATRVVVTMEGTTIGTPTYMSPEQALGTDLTPATDLYSLGVVAWELLTGTVPFEESDTPVAILYRHVHEPVPSVRTVVPTVDEAIAAWLERMLQKRPEDRFQSADEAWVELEDVILELLGPRWRRQARLALEEGARGEGTLTPAEFRRAGLPAVDGASPATPPATAPPATQPPKPSPPPELPDRVQGAERQIAPTVTGLSMPALVTGPDTPIPGELAVAPGADTGAASRNRPSKTTIAPRRSPRRSNTTVFRIARRHRDAGEGDRPLTPDTLRRRLIAAGIILAMAAAAVVGVVLAQPAAKPAPPERLDTAAALKLRAARARAAETQAAAAATATGDQQVFAVVKGLAVTRNRSLTRVLNARTAHAQAAAAAGVGKTYAAAAKRVAPLSSETAAAGPLADSLKTTAADYAHLAAAGRADSQKRWKRYRGRITADERTLQHQISRL